MCTCMPTYLPGCTVIRITVSSGKVCRARSNWDDNKQRLTKIGIINSKLVVKHNLHRGTEDEKLQ
jgi:hypothetical protein